VETPIPRKKRRKADNLESVDNTPKRRGRKKKTKAPEPESQDNDMEDGSSSEVTRGRGSAKRKGKKRKSKAQERESQDDDKEDGTDEEARTDIKDGIYVEKSDDESNGPSIGAKVGRSLSPSPNRDSDGEHRNGKDLVFLDSASWKREREALDDSFQSARSHFKKKGPWTLPSALNANKFRDVANLTLTKMTR
jgi:hypothetical protein